MIKITHQRKKCIGCGSCTENSPGFWRLSEKDGKADLVGSKKDKGIFALETNDEFYEENTKAAEDCPVHIIRVEKRN
jgi:ferredoxin